MMLLRMGDNFMTPGHQQLIRYSRTGAITSHTHNGIAQYRSRAAIVRIRRLMNRKRRKLGGRLL